MNVDAVNFGHVLRNFAECFFSGPPVVFCLPIGTKLLDILKGNALGPIVDGFRFRPSRSGQTVIQVIQVRVVDMNLKSSYVVDGDSLAAQSGTYQWK